MGERKLPTILIIGAGPAHKIGGKVIIFTLLCTRVKSLLKCIPKSIDTRIHEVVPDPIGDGIEKTVVTVHDHLGKILFKTPGYQVKCL
ncbi:5552_t:CDS:2 [Funneliformis caledonium]|uniref:5552_t:CDS:1 n=1 Tax=Funneliformis caledonium TaxID=1117310 RepID=A0A9N9F4M6_9GLOM|nr:5552_t:CDS:2 [Funneliformis caledonium]